MVYETPSDLERLKAKFQAATNSLQTSLAPTATPNPAGALAGLSVPLVPAVGASFSLAAGQCGKSDYDICTLLLCAAPPIKFVLPSNIKQQGYWIEFCGSWRRVREITPHLIDLAKTISSLPNFSNSNTLQKIVERLSSDIGARAITRFLADLPVVQVSEDAFDSDPLTFGFDDKLCTPSLPLLIRPQTQNDLLLKSLPVTLNRKLACPLWIETLEKICLGNADYIAYLQIILGRCLVETHGRRKIYLLHGEGMNGKSVITRVMTDILGQDYRTTLRASAITTTRNISNANQFTLHPLKGKRLAIINELPENARLIEEVVKSLTGYDNISAESKGKDAEQFSFSGTLLIATNYLPKFTPAQAIQDRIVVLPFDYRVPDGEEDSELFTKLRAEYPAILYWLIHGAQLALATRIDTEFVVDKIPQVVLTRTAACFVENNPITEWAAEYLVSSAGSVVSCARAFADYLEWAHDNNERYTTTCKKFTKNARQAGYILRHTSTGMVFYGYTIGNLHNFIPTRRGGYTSEP